MAPVPARHVAEAAPRRADVVVATCRQTEPSPGATVRTVACTVVDSPHLCATPQPPATHPSAPALEATPRLASAIAAVAGAQATDALAADRAERSAAATEQMTRASRSDDGAASRPPPMTSAAVAAPPAAMSAEAASSDAGDGAGSSDAGGGGACLSSAEAALEVKSRELMRLRRELRDVERTAAEASARLIDAQRERAAERQATLAAEAEATAAQAAAREASAQARKLGAQLDWSREHAAATESAAGVNDAAAAGRARLEAMLSDKDAEIAALREREASASASADDVRRQLQERVAEACEEAMAAQRMHSQIEELTSMLGAAKAQAADTRRGWQAAEAAFRREVQSLLQDREMALLRANASEAEAATERDRAAPCLDMCKAPWLQPSAILGAFGRPPGPAVALDFFFGTGQKAAGRSSGQTLLTAVDACEAGRRYMCGHRRRGRGRRRAWVQTRVLTCAGRCGCSRRRSDRVCRRVCGRA